LEPEAVKALMVEQVVVEDAAKTKK
jgi:hypothetical protein